MEKIKCTRRFTKVGREIPQMESVMKNILTILALLISSYAIGFDHAHKKWDEILKSKTIKKDEQVLVNYKSIKANQVKLNSYLKELEKVSKKEFNNFSKQEQLAFWINAYNAYTVKLIVKNYPVKSIKDIGSFFSSPWSKDFITLLGKKMSLDDIEHETIRKDFKEPRIHFAVNCASIGCPSLYQEAFVASRIDKQLEVATKLFLNNKNKNKIKKDRILIC